MRISDWSSDVCSSDLLFEQRLRLPCLESPIHESDRFPDTAIITIKPRQDHDKPATILFSRTSETIARFCGMPRLQPVSSCNLRSEEHTSELQSLMRISYAVFCLKKNTT